jgi:hypothetical protein
MTLQNLKYPSFETVANASFKVSASQHIMLLVTIWPCAATTPDGPFLLLFPQHQPSIIMSCSEPAIPHRREGKKATVLLDLPHTYRSVTCYCNRPIHIGTAHINNRRLVTITIKGFDVSHEI